jgi:hypothetical protein
MYKNVQNFFSHLNVRGYAVLVSEIMLQQTQVATVIQYYKYGILLKILNERSLLKSEDRSRFFAEESVSRVRMRARVSLSEFKEDINFSKIICENLKTKICRKLFAKTFATTRKMSTFPNKCIEKVKVGPLSTRYFKKILDIKRRN